MENEKEIKIKVPNIKMDVDNDDEDIAKLKEVLKAVSDFISDLKKPIEDLMKIAIDQLSGEKLGKDIASFYKTLLDTGMDKKLVEELTKKYFEERMEAANAMKTLMGSLSGAFGKGGFNKNMLKELMELKKMKESLKQEKEGSSEQSESEEE